MSVSRLEIRYGHLRPWLSVMGVGPRWSGVTIDGASLTVRMGWAFRSKFPLSAVIEAAAFEGRVGGIGVHGWNGTWLVNGGIEGLVELIVDPPQRAYVLGVPVKLRRLRLSLQEPDALLQAVAGG